MLAASPTQRNRLLARLSQRDFQLLKAHLEPVVLKLRHDLEKPNRPIEDVYFMETGIASVVAVQSGEKRVEVGLIGCEGMSGSAVMLGNHRSPHSTYIQVEGEGQRIKSDKIRKAMEDSPSLRGVFLRYVQAFMVQTAHTAIANARTKLDQRLARWILMAHDRVASSTLPLTHEFLSLMLGVRRAGVTETLHALSEQGLIRAGVGKITMLNRKGLERCAGVSYGVPEAEFRRLIG